MKKYILATLILGILSVASVSAKDIYLGMTNNTYNWYLREESIRKQADGIANFTLIKARKSGAFTAVKVFEINDTLMLRDANGHKMKTISDAEWNIVDKASDIVDTKLNAKRK